MLIFVDPTLHVPCCYPLSSSGRLVLVSIYHQPVRGIWNMNEYCSQSSNNKQTRNKLFLTSESDSSTGSDSVFHPLLWLWPQVNIICLTCFLSSVFWREEGGLELMMWTIFFICLCSFVMERRMLTRTSNTAKRRTATPTSWASCRWNRSSSASFSSPSFLRFTRSTTTCNQQNYCMRTFST